MKRKFVVKASADAKKRAIYGGSGAKLMPPWTEIYYDEGGIDVALDRGFGIDVTDENRTRNMYADEGIDYISTIYAKPDYIELLDAAGLGKLDVVVSPETGELITMTVLRQGVVEITEDDVQDALVGKDFLA